jgi:mannose-6-phosphate isomerase-like protein (cupin superfamily)
MSDFTITNLEDVDDAAPGFGFAELGEVRFANEAVGAQSTGLSWHRLRPDARQPFGHTHDDAEEVYVVLAGSGRVRLDDDIRDVRRMDAVRVAPQVKRAFEAGPDGLELLAFGPRHDGDGELDFEFWKD